MRKSPLQLIEQHVEKVILALAVAFAGYLAFTYFVQTPHVVEFGGEQLGAAEIDSAIAQKAQQLDAAMNRAVDEAEPLPDFAQQLDESARSGIFATAEGETPLNTVLRWSTPLGPALPSLGAEGVGGSVRLVGAIAPGVPAVRSGRAIVEMRDDTISLTSSTEGGPTPDMPDGVPRPTRETPWISVAAYWNYKAQEALHREAGYVSYRARPYVARVVAERQRLMPDGRWSEWERVTQSDAMPTVELPSVQNDPLTNRISNLGEISSAFNQLKEQQLQVAQPRFPDVVNGEPWAAPELPGYRPTDWPRIALAEMIDDRSGPTLARAGDESPGMAPTGRDDAGDRRGRDEPRGQRPTAGLSRDEARAQAQRDLAAARQALARGAFETALTRLDAVMNNDEARRPTLRVAETLRAYAEQLLRRTRFNAPWWRPDGPRGLVDPADPARIAVWFHDDSVLAGQSYRYRLRVDLWNRHVGRPQDLAQPEFARELVIEGEWSPPSAPIAAPPPAYIFVRGGQADRNAARLEVWKWRTGWWVSDNFDVAPGEQIGGVGRVESGEFLNDRPVLEAYDFATGAQLVDIRFDETVLQPAGRGAQQYIPRQTVVVMYTDPATGDLVQRSAAADADDPVYERLRDIFQ